MQYQNNYETYMQRFLFPACVQLKNALQFPKRRDNFGNSSNILNLNTKWITISLVGFPGWPDP